MIFLSKINVFSIFLLFTFNTNAQDNLSIGYQFQEFNRLAMTHLEKGAIDSSLYYLSKTDSCDLNYHGDYFNYLFTFFSSYFYSDLISDDQLNQAIEIPIKNGFSFKTVKRVYNDAKLYGNKIPEQDNTALLFPKLSDLVDKKKMKSWQSETDTKPTNKKLLKKLKKIGRLDQKGNRDLSYEKQEISDSIVFEKIMNLVKEHGKFPSHKEVGLDGHDILTTCIVHFTPKRLIQILPYILESINNGAYFDNKEIAYGIDRNSTDFGSYFKFDDNQIILLKSDSTFDKMYFSNIQYLYNYDKVKKERIYIPYSPLLSKTDVNLIRFNLCLPALQ